MHVRILLTVNEQIQVVCPDHNFPGRGPKPMTPSSPPSVNVPHPQEYNFPVSMPDGEIVVAGMRASTNWFVIGSGTGRQRKDHC
jgi:hypothetical protein